MKLNELQKGKGYISLTLCKRDTTRIHQVLDNLGVKDYIPDLHLTLMYDRSNPNIQYDKNTDTYIASIKSCKTLGDPGSTWFSIALDLDSNDLSKRHKELLDLGFKHSYPNFIAHISLKYKPTKNDIDTIESNIDQFIDLGDVKLEKETVKEIKE